ncbi:MAG: glucose-1-phosphate cytidylyltransferase [Leptospirales bacterium]|nr:glucose-1-phosphate cytidylyltransferase [Leptospirales bacterium]
MKAVILAGGLGSRISEESSVRPKPLIEVGGKPVLWHIMKIYSHYGVNDFIICLGYKGYMIKEYFANYFLHMSDVTIELANNKMSVHQQYAEPWRITLIDTGEKTMTGGRLKRVRDHVSGEDFCLTYGDGVADINIEQLVKFHKSHGKAATLTAVQPPGRFGVLRLQNDSITAFEEKPSEGGWINGGFFVLSPSVIDLIQDDETVWEREPMVKLAADGNLKAYFHDGFWQPMDTLRDKQQLEGLWESRKAPWRVW